MKRTLFALGILTVSLGITSPSQAQRVAKPDTTEPFPHISSDSNIAPEMWFYMEEYRRYQSPKEAVRRKAQMRSQQRANRLAAQRWFGFSNLRPQASPVPQMGTYSPSWQANNWNPYGWTGVSQPVTTLYVTRPADDAE